MDEASITSKVIAMIDDEKDFLEMADTILTSEGYATMCTTEPLVFIEYFQFHHIDLAILDVEMPEKSGFEIAEELREGGADPKMPVIFLSGHRQAADQLQGFYSGANEYLFKPVNRHELLETVKKLMKT